MPDETEPTIEESQPTPDSAAEPEPAGPSAAPAAAPESPEASAAPSEPAAADAAAAETPTPPKKAGSPTEPVSGSRPMGLPNFPEAGARAVPAELDLLSDVNLNVKIELGRTRLLIDDVLRLGDGAVVELDKLAGDPVDIYVNDRHIARGEVLVLNDNFCVRINEILDPETKQAG